MKTSSENINLFNVSNLDQPNLSVSQKYLSNIGDFLFFKLFDLLRSVETGNSEKFVCDH